MKENLISEMPMSEPKDVIYHIDAVYTEKEDKPISLQDLLNKQEEYFEENDKERDSKN